MKTTILTLLILSIFAASTLGSTEATYQETSNTLSAREANPDDLILPSFARSTSPYKRRVIRRLERRLQRLNGKRTTIRKKVFHLQAAYDKADRKFRKARRRLNGFRLCLKDRARFFQRCRRRRDFYRANKFRCRNIKTCGYRSKIERHYRSRTAQRNEAAERLRKAMGELRRIRNRIKKVERELSRLLGSVKPMPSVMPRKVW